jgi:hypothetical protein
VGDFDGNGFDDVVWHATGSARDFVWWSGPGGFTSQPLSVQGSYVPIAGDFDGNGVDDILWYATGPASDSVWYFRSNRSYVSRPTRQDLITAVPIVGRFDDNATDDVFFYGPGSADDALWRGNSDQTFTRANRPVNGWYQPVALDATGDGRDEILWYAPGTASTYRWHFSASGAPGSRSIATAPLRGRPTAGDFDGDGLEDALIVAPGSSADAAWYSTPTGIEQRKITVNGSYTIVTGPMDRTAPGISDDVLFVSAAASHFWHGDLGRSFVSTRVG